MKTRSILALACGMLMSSSAFAAQLFFTTASTLNSTTAVTAATQNPTLVLNGPGATGNLWLWAKLAPPTNRQDDGQGNVSYTAAETIIGMGLDVVTSNTAAAHGTTFSVTGSSTRFDAPNGTATPQSSGGESVGTVPLARFSRGSVAKLGLTDLASVAVPDDTVDTLDSQATNVLGSDGNVYLRFASITVAGDASTPPGTPAALNLVVNSKKFAENPGNSTVVFFGAGDAATSGAASGNTTTLPDAFIAVTVPEPASLSLLGLGALCLIRRRKA